MKNLRNITLGCLSLILLANCKKEEKSDIKEITSFAVSNDVDSVRIDKANHSVYLYVAFSSDISSLQPVIEVSAGAGIEPNSSENIQFTGDTAKYQVKAENGSIQEWIVVLVRGMDDKADITGFYMEGQKGDAVIYSDSVVLEVKPPTDLSDVIANITISEYADIMPDPGSGIDFSNGKVKFTITAQNGSQKEYFVIVKRAPNYENYLTSFTLDNQMGEAEFQSENVIINVPFKTDIAALKPTIGISNYAGISPASGEAVDFSKGRVMYSVTSEEKYTRYYYVYVNYGPVPADNPYYQYMGRVDFTNPKKPVFWAPGIYVKAKYKGTGCVLVMNDQMKWGNKNYLEVIFDDTIQQKIQLTGAINNIELGMDLPYGEHTILICKDTEANIGYVEFLGLSCEELLPLDDKPVRKMEFIGNSITCGTGSDLTEYACDSRYWFDQHNAYMSYGARTARALNAQWHITAVSGIGVIHSCCDQTTLMPQVFDKINIHDNSGSWDFTRYIPDVVTICLGQNDGYQDSAFFVSTYVGFVKTIRSKYPNADIICLTSPMADAGLTALLKDYLTGVVNQMNGEGDNKVHKFYFSKSFNSGCGYHPDMDEHGEIAAELTSFVKALKGW